MINYGTSLTTSAELLLPSATSFFLVLGKSDLRAPALRAGFPQDSVGAGAPLPSCNPGTRARRGRGLGPCPGTRAAIEAGWSCVAQHSQTARWPRPSRTTTTQTRRDNIEDNSYGTVWHETPPPLHDYVFGTAVARGRTLLRER